MCRTLTCICVRTSLCFHLLWSLFRNQPPKPFLSLVLVPESTTKALPLITQRSLVNCDYSNTTSSTSKSLKPEFSLISKTSGNPPLPHPFDIPISPGSLKPHWFLILNCMPHYHPLHPGIGTVLSNNSITSFNATSLRGSEIPSWGSVWFQMRRPTGRS